MMTVFNAAIAQSVATSSETANLLMVVWLIELPGIIKF